MTDRSIRRAAERKAAKAARKAARNNLTATAALSTPDSSLLPPASSLLPPDSSLLPPDSSLLPPPISEAQLVANRANAQLAHGPVTPEGKAISSRNHTTHGLTALPTPGFQVLPGEDQSAFNRTLGAFEKDWTPANATEHELVHRLAVHTWLQARAVRLQNNILAELGEIRGVEERKEFALLMRYEAANQRAFSKALSEIVRLKNFQRSQEKSQTIQERRLLETQIRFESQKQKAELHAAKMETIRLKQEAIKQRNQRLNKLVPAGEQPIKDAAASKIAA